MNQLRLTEPPGITHIALPLASTKFQSSLLHAHRVLDRQLEYLFGTTRPE